VDACPKRGDHGMWWRLVRFGLVGAAGMLVNATVFAAATETGLPALAAAFLSMEVATGFNFAVSERAVFAGRAHGRRWVRATAFFALATAGFLVTGPLMVAFLAAGMVPLPADLLAIV